MRIAGLNELRADLEDHANRLGTFRSYIKHLDTGNRRLFFDLARNRPGPGPSIVHPEHHGFLEIESSTAEDIAENVDRAPRYVARSALISELVTLTHKLAPNFTVYIGRTYLREGEAHLGPRQRWNAHWYERDMQYAAVVGRIRRDLIEPTESLALALVGCWAEYGALCCNNDVYHGKQRVTDDDHQLIYMCLRERN